MPRYCFHRIDGGFDPDTEGTELADLDAARAEAVQFAAGTVWDHPDYVWDGKDFCIEVADAGGDAPVHRRGVRNRLCGGPGQMTKPFVRRLESFTPLSKEQRRQIEALTTRVQAFGSRETVVREGEEPRCVNVVLDGWAGRFKALHDGRHQVVSQFLPGDMCDHYVFLLGVMDHIIGTITPAKIAKVPAHAIRDLTANWPGLAEALWWKTLVAIEIQRECTVSLARRTPVERLAHLFCEITTRLAGVGLSDGSECELPLTQTDLVDATGLSTVHVNRSIQQMRASGLIELRNRRLTIRDPQRLAELGVFTPAYLHQRAN